MEQTRVELMTLSREETSKLQEGVTLVNKSENEKYIIYRDSDEFTACKNICKHQGGTFIKDIEDTSKCILKCTKHGWKLDPSTMRYVNPPDSFRQEQLVADINDDGCLTLTELRPPQPWEENKRDPQPIELGEVKMTYFTHACMRFEFKDIIFFTDPWLTGPAFARGWWLMHEPPADWLDELAKADLIYISHLHSDHLKYDAIFFFSLNLISAIFHHHFLLSVNKDLRFMIMMDGVHPDMDTCLLIDYKGHLILNTVDCTNPNGGKLPSNVDVMMSDFAGGASGFPMAFTGGKYTEQWKAEFVKRERKKLLYYKTQVIRDVAPKVYCPFAGYFVEAHPSDNDYVTTPTPGTKVMKDSWEFDKYVDAINGSYDNEIFAYPEWIKFYYDWTGFNNYNLVIRMIETDDNFEPIEGGYDFLVDFIGQKPSYPRERPQREHSYLEMKNRMGVHRETVIHGLFWDNLYIGFNNRISREPDTFHYLFWNHMQILLKKEPPQWKKFLKEQRAKGAEKKAVWKPHGGLEALKGCSMKNGQVPYGGEASSKEGYSTFFKKYWKLSVPTIVLLGAVLFAFTKD
ncbi:cytidine monophosphate-N-acetylneuraminic acid hydroxylase-like [Anneissia japonica]|uniref:cytidine monophosphate-N-acetylneuraminic acid hydroxylase-like n=1 Tax=Anneissia japonica TaxID=1529436 RepID=UPI00142556EB|nr:cytidine monophosphate-N-acetylneuraminic acid hydroxylase-like [Anneissia japonica]